ncbi:MAG: hypothetical protein K9N23_08985 [Akkermansiaceae bacterium]|nr:hypothetical protein [Akkermansiaceae bacterium]
MTTIAAIFRKDFHQFRILIGLLVGLLAVLLAVRLEWTGSVVPDPASNMGYQPFLESILFLFTVVIAGRLTAYVCFEDSPSRRERYLATRPVTAAPLACAKLAFLAAFVVAPFAIAAALYLALSGMPFRVIALGTLESLVRTLVLLGLGVPLILLWETRRRLIAGIAALCLGLTVFVLAIGLLQERRSALLPFRPDVFADPLIQVVTVAIAAILLAVLAFIHLRRPLKMVSRLTTVFLAVAVAPLLGGLLRSGPATAPAANIAPCGMVRASINPYQANNIPSVSINLSPDRETPADQDVTWSIAEIALGTHKIPQRPRSDPRLVPSHYFHQGGLTPGLEAAIHRYVGPEWALVTPRHGRPMAPNSAGTLASEADLPSGPAPLDAVFQGHGFTWHRVAELPLIPGSEARDSDATWTYHGHALQTEGSLILSLTHQGPELWLDPQGRSPVFENRGYRFFLLDPQRQLATPFDDHHPVRRNLAIGTACPRRGLVLQLSGSGESNTFTATQLESFRLLILRPRYEGVRFCRWTSPAPIAFRSTLPAGPNGLANTPYDLKPTDIARWIAAHPSPGSGASSAEVARYLVSLLEQTNRSSPLPKNHPATAALSIHVPGHLELFLRALTALHTDHHASQMLLFAALDEGLEHRQLPEIVRHLLYHPMLVTLITSRGWTADVAPDLARLIRNGNLHQNLLEAAAALPDGAGITRDEWLAVFRLEPTSSTYLILRDIPGLEPAVAAEVDARMTDRIPLLMATSVDPLLDLALVRGHPRAPTLLHHALRYAIDQHEHHSGWFSNTVQSHFDISGPPNLRGDPDRIVSWFLAEDPAAFTFDPATRLYTTEKPQN